jgi:hypothetical protein
MVMTKFWVDDDGTLTKATDDSQDLSLGLTEVPIPPESGKQVWNGSKWTDPDNVLVLTKRRREYPSIGDQLDMIYWDKVNGTANWIASIDKVKTDNPK